VSGSVDENLVWIIIALYSLLAIYT